MKTARAILLLGLSVHCGGCTNTQTVSAGLTDALDAASIAESVYAAQQSSNPQTVAKLANLLAAAQAAVTTWQTSSKPEDQAVAAAALAALVEYESASGVKP